MVRHVACFVYPGFALLDLSGPLEAFAAANERAPGSYRLSVMSIEGGSIASSTGLTVETQRVTAQGFDTFVVVGDFGLLKRSVPAESVEFIRAASAASRRTASVCMGACLLAACGLLEGRRATTHWRYAAALQSLYPTVRVNGDRIYINDGGMWTSAGMTAGIDMVLALIEEDLGRDAARAVARMLVVYYRRPGGQMQHSSLLELDPQSDRIGAALAFMRERLSEPLSIGRVAEAVHLSARQFGRAFLQSTGMTPAKAIERLRVEAARPAVEDGRLTLDSIARKNGFGDADRMRESFLRLLGQAPQALRSLTRRTGSGSKAERV
jgi:transcriptional regulator GlxA family with amidase domain